MVSPKDDVRFQLSADLFPMVYRDVETGVYVAELAAPPPGEASRHAQMLVDCNALDAIAMTDLRLVQRMAYWSQPGTVMTLNPGFAFAEQILSNAENTSAKIKGWEEKLAPSGLFPQGYASNFYPFLQKQERAIREQVGIIFCYLALFEHWSTEFRKNDQALQCWIDLFNEDIPRLKVLYLLGGLFIISLADEALRLRGAKESVAAWRQAICDDRAKEKDDYPRRLRNRAMDILYFMLSPTLTFTTAGGYKSRIMLATEDRFLGEFLCRIFHWVHTPENGLWGLRMCSEQFESKRGNASIESIKTLVNKEPEARKYKDIPGEREAKLRRLARLTLQTLPADRRTELQEALDTFHYPK